MEKCSIRRSPSGNSVQGRASKLIITKEDYVKLLENDCHYCQSPLNDCGVGLDRLDNDKGYLLDNVLPCCSSCNRTRSDNYTYEEMLVLAVTIRKIKSARKDQGHEVLVKDTFDL